MFFTDATLEKGMVCTEPERSRSRMVRMLRPSTTPARPSTSTTSPMFIVPSIRMKRPVMTSLTRALAPNATAMPMIEAPASRVRC